MKTPTSKASFRRWLKAQFEIVEALDATDPDFYDMLDVADTAEQAARLACRFGAGHLVDTGPVMTVRQALAIVGRLLAWSEESDPDLLSAPQVAERLGVSVRSIWRMVSANEISAPIKIRGRSLFRRPDIEVMMDLAPSIRLINRASVYPRKRKKHGRVVQAGKFTCQFSDPTTGKTCRVPGFSDRKESLDLARRLETGSSSPDHRKHRKTPILAHLEAFVLHLEAQNNCPKYVDNLDSRIKKILDGCKFQSLREITLPAVEVWLAEQRTAKVFGIKTSNEYGSAMRQFLSWLVDADRADRNPLAKFTPLTDTDKKRERRALGNAEFSMLIATTLAGPDYHGLSGPDRAMLYLVAAYTGLRVSELASLTPESCVLYAGIVVVEAACYNRRRLDRQPLPNDLVARLRAWLPGRSGTLWPGRWQRDAASMLRPDLEAAAIPYVEAGKVLDFHALGRHTFCSNLALANVPVKVAQVLARHSTITLTMDRYAMFRRAMRSQGLRGSPRCRR